VFAEFDRDRDPVKRCSQLTMFESMADAASSLLASSSESNLKDGLNNEMRESNHGDCSAGRESPLFKEIIIDDDTTETFCAFAVHPHLKEACESCGVGFSLFNRRHHCRGCGKSVCSEHSRMLSVKTTESDSAWQAIFINSSTRTCTACEEELVNKARQQSVILMAKGIPIGVREMTAHRSQRQRCKPHQPSDETPGVSGADAAPRPRLSLPGTIKPTLLSLKPGNPGRSPRHPLAVIGPNIPQETDSDASCSLSDDGSVAASSLGEEPFFVRALSQTKQLHGARYQPGGYLHWTGAGT
jgi:hypothetical protein